MMNPVEEVGLNAMEIRVAEDLRVTTDIMRGLPTSGYGLDAYREAQEGSRSPGAQEGPVLVLYVGRQPRDRDGGCWYY